MRDARPDLRRDLYKPTAGMQQGGTLLLHEKSTEKIDGAVATIMALDRAIRNQNINTDSVYNERGLIII